MTAAADALETTLLGARLAVPLMNAPGTIETARDVEMLVGMGTGAVCLRPVTVQPFLHPQFRALKNPGHDRLLPMVRQLAALGTVPVVACVAGSTAEELGFLARVFGEAGAALVQLHLSDLWVAATLAPFQDLDTLRGVLEAVRAQATTPVLCEVPSEVWRHYGEVGEAVREAGIGGVVVRGDFTGLEKFLLDAGPEGIEIVAVADVESGWAARRVLDKGARAIQIDRPVRAGGPATIARIAGELRAVRRGP